MFGFQHITQLCQSLHFPKSNCTCDNLGIISQSGDNFCTSGNISVVRDPKEVHLTSFTAVADVLGIVGNSVVIYILWRKETNASRHTQLIKYLAVCDFVFALLSFLNNTPSFWTDEWIYGRAGCKIIGSGIQLGALVATGMIFIIAIERFVGIVFPLKRLSDITTYLLILGNITVGIAAVIPRVIFLEVYSEDASCRESWPNLNNCAGYSWAMMIIYFILPITAMSFLYWRIFKALKRNFTSRYRTTSVHTDTLYRRRVKENKRVMFLLVAVHIAFITFTFPNKLRWVIYDTAVATTGHYFRADTFYFISEAMYPFHTAINPFIYTIANEKFRNLLMKNFKCRRRLNS